MFILLPIFAKPNTANLRNNLAEILKQCGESVWFVGGQIL